MALETYKGVPLLPGVDDDLEKQLIDRGMGDRRFQLTPGAVQNNKISTQPETKSLLDTRRENTLSAIKYLNAVDESAAGQLKDDKGQPILVSDMSLMQQTAGSLFHVMKQIGSGVLGTAESISRGVEWLGVDSAKPLGDKLADWQRAVAVEDPTFADNLSRGIGSLAMFFAPGVGIAKGASMITKVSPRIAMLFGNSASTAIEAMSEAGDTWQEAKDSGVSESEADKRATKVFWSNAVLIGITNKFGAFSDKATGEIKRILMSAPIEGIQEFGQQVIGNTTAGRKWDTGAYEAAAIGTILGGFMGMQDFGFTARSRGQDMTSEQINGMVDQAADRLGVSKDQAKQVLAGVRDMIDAEQRMDDKPDIFKKAIDTAKTNIGEESSIYANAVDQAKKNVVESPETIIEGMQTTQPDLRQIFAPGIEDGTLAGVYGDATYFTEEQLGDEGIQANTSDFQIRTFNTIQEQADFIEKYNADSLSDAIIKEGKFDAFAVQTPSGIRYGVVDKQRVADAMDRQQFISTEEALAASEEFAFIRDLALPVQAKQLILTPSGQRAFGRYSNGMIQFLENPKATTLPHEATHAFLDLMVSRDEKQKILDEVKRRYAGKKYDNKGAEERLAEDFAKYYTEKKTTGKAKGPSTRIRQMFDWFIDKLNTLFGGERKIDFDKLYRDIETKKPGIIQKRAIRRRMDQRQESVRDLQQEYFQDPEKLTSKFLKNVDVANRETASYQFLKNLLNSKSLPLKQSERDLISDVLESQFKDEKKINMDDFRAAVTSELMPLDVIMSDTYADYGASSIGRDDVESETHIYNSQFIHGKTGHFSSDFSADRPSGLFGHTRVWDEDYYDNRNKRFIAEIQSDFFQKYNPKELEMEMAVRKGGEKNIKGVIDTLDKYKNTWHERMIREEIRRAAMDNKKYLYFPTPRTVAAIEGYAGGENIIPYEILNGNKEELLPGDTIEFIGDEHTVIMSDVYSITVARTDDVVVFSDSDARYEHAENMWEDFVSELTDLEEKYGSIQTVEKANDVIKKHGDEYNTAIEVLQEYVIDNYTEQIDWDQVEEDYREKQSEEMEYDGIYETFAIGDDGMVYATNEPTENLMQPDQYDQLASESDFDIEEFGQEQQTVLNFYKSKVLKYVEKLRKENTFEYLDDEGFRWIGTEIKPEDREAVEAFQTENNEETGIEPSLAADLQYRRNQQILAREQDDLSKQLRIENARQSDLTFFDSEKENGYQNFIGTILTKSGQIRRQFEWVMDEDTDDTKLKEGLPGVNVDDVFFSGAGDVTNDELLEMFKDRYRTEEQLKEVAREETPMEEAMRRKKAIEKEVRDQETKRTQTIKQAINTSIGNEQPQKITAKETTLLKTRIKAIKRGVQMGRQDMRQTMIDAFRTKIAELQDIKDAVVGYAQQLPQDKRGSLLNMVARAKTQRDLLEAFMRIDNMVEQVDKTRAVAEVKRTANDALKAMRTGRGIALEYQRRVLDILAGYDLKNPTKRTMSRLRGLKDFLSSQPKEERPIIVDGQLQIAQADYVPPRVIQQIDRLTKKPLMDMDATDIRDLNNTLDQLIQLGRLKQNLRNNYNERYRQQQLAVLVDNTVSLDPKGDEASESYRTKANLIKTNLSTQHSFRVTDRLDGTQDYRGPNTKLQRKLWKATTNADLATDAILTDTFNRIKSVKDNWTEDDMTAMELHLLLEMGSYDVAQRLIYSKGLKALPEKTPEMSMAMDLMRGVFEHSVGYLQTVYETINNKSFERVENYFPLKYERKKGELPEPTIGQQISRTTKPKQGFTFARQKGVKRVPRTDVFGQFEEAIREQQYYMYVQPALLDVHSLINDESYMEKAGTIASQWWRDYIDSLANRGQLSGIRSNPLLRKARINLSRAILGYKISSILMQPMAVFDALAYAQMRFGAGAAGRLLANFAGVWINPRMSQRIVAQSPALQIRRGGDLSVEEVDNMTKGKKGIFGWWQKNALSMLQWSDMKTAAAVQNSFYGTLRKEGLSHEEARSEADMLMNIVSGSSDIADRPMVLMSGEGARTVFTFGTFMLNRWGLISHDILGTGIVKGKISRKIKGFIALMILAMGGGVEDKLRGRIFEILSGKKLSKDEDFLFNSLMSIPESAPIIGQMVRGMRQYNQSYSIPLTRTIENAVSGMRMVFSDEKSTKKKGALKLTESIATLFGVAGTAQIFDFAERVVVPPEKKQRQIPNNPYALPDIPLPTLPSLPSF